MSSRARIAGISLICLAAVPLAAQGGTAVDIAKIVQFAVPATPALSFIGSTSEKITRPTTPKDAITQLSNAIDESGKVVQGLAIELSPRLLFWPKMDLKDYQKPVGFLLAHTAFSVGSAKVAGDSSSTNLGAGVRITLIDKSDPLAAQMDILPAVHRCSGDHPIPDGGAALTAWRKCWRAEDSTFRATFAAEHWNDFALTVSAATGQQLARSEFSNHRAMGYGANALLAVPLALGSWLRAHGQVLAQVGYESRDSIVGPATGHTATSFGARLTLGTGSIGGFLEWIGSHRSDGNAGAVKLTSNQSEWSAGIEFKVSESLWATTGFGSRYDALEGKNKSIVLAGIKVKISGSRSLSAIVPAGQ